MDISFKCSSCGQNVVIDEAGVGLTVQCPKCGQPLIVPSPDSAVVASDPLIEKALEVFRGTLSSRDAAVVGCSSTIEPTAEQPPPVAESFREKGRKIPAQEKKRVAASDIRFRCQHCSRRMVIDKHGAGLSIECPSCHQTTTVPITKKLSTDRAYLVRDIEDAAIVAERGGNTCIHSTRNKLQDLANLAGPDEAAVINRAVEWLNSRIAANEEVRLFDDRLEAKPVPNCDLANRLKQVALSLRERWGITQRWELRGLNSRQEREVRKLADSQFYETHPGATHADLPPTERQVEFLQFLGAAIPNNLTRDQASALLDELVHREDLRDRVSSWYLR